MNYAEIKNTDIANGLGVRVSLFVSGCTHHCKNCFNSIAWDFLYGKPFTQETEEMLFNMLDHSYIAGLTLLGGEPLEPANQKGLISLLRKFREKFGDKKNIWCYTGYTFESDLLNASRARCDVTDEFLSYIDILVDGKFIEEKKDFRLKFRGSSNQRIIDVKKSLEQNETILFEI